jgi:hypothetical protein
MAVTVSNSEYVQAEIEKRLLVERLKGLEELAESQRELIDELQKSLRRERERKYADSL